MSEISDAWAATRAAAERVASLIDAGWRADQHPAAISLTSAGSPTELLTQVESLDGFVREARLELVAGPAVVRILVNADGSRVVEPVESPDLSLVFRQGDQLTAARRAWAGDLQATLSLSGDWTARISLDLGRRLNSADPLSRWMVLLRAEHFLQYLASQAPWEWGEAWNEPVRVAIRDVDSSFEVATESVHVLSLGASAPTLTLRRVPPPRTPPQLNQVPSPLALFPRSLGGDEVGIGKLMARLSAAAAWISLSTEARTSPSGDLEVEYFGLQRVRHGIPRTGLDLTDAQVESVVDLWEWAAADRMTDQLLAAQQVISLYTAKEPWGYAADIKQAAESVFLSLRHDAVAEAFRAQREAREVALTVSRQTAEATAALTRSAVERSVALVAGVVGTVLAYSTDALTVRQAADLQCLLAIAMFAVGAWNALVEGPLVTVASKHLAADLEMLSDLLSPGDRAAAARLPSLEATKARARVARFVVPLLFLLLGVATLVVRSVLL